VINIRQFLIKPELYFFNQLIIRPLNELTFVFPHLYFVKRWNILIYNVLHPLLAGQRGGFGR
jgi:hypothetical protein